MTPTQHHLFAYLGKRKKSVKGLARLLIEEWGADAPSFASVVRRLGYLRNGTQKEPSLAMAVALSRVLPVPVEAWRVTDAAHCTKRMGELLAEVEKDNPRKAVRGLSMGRGATAKAAGLSPRQAKQALRVAKVPERRKEESSSPPPASRVTGSRP